MCPISPIPPLPIHSCRVTLSELRHNPYNHRDSKRINFSEGETKTNEFA